PDAVFINSESSEFNQACCPDEPVTRTADFENERRFIALDLLYGVEPAGHVRRYLLENGMGAGEYDGFMPGGRAIARRSVLGVDYYQWNEKLINSECRPESL